MGSQSSPISASLLRPSREFASIRQGRHQAPEAGYFLLYLGHLQGVPDISLAARYHRFTDFTFEQIDIRDRRPARAGDEDAVGFGGLFIESFGDLIRRMHVHVRQIGIFSDSIALDFQYVKSRDFKESLHALVERIFVRRGY